jgi:hypothetical protein
MLVAFQGVAANQLRQPVGLMRVGCLDGPHFVEHYGETALRELPCGFCAGQPAANDGYKMLQLSFYGLALLICPESTLVLWGGCLSGSRNIR